jgi:hypothetical protein
MNKFIFLVLMIISNTIFANQDRWILIGDSIMSNVTESNSNIVGLSRNLAAHLVEEKANVVIHNLSSPGARMADGGIKGFGFVNYKNSINHVSGYFGVKGIIITLGTNDWGYSTPGEYFTAYLSVIKHAKSLGLKVVCVSPIWRADENSFKQPKGDKPLQLWVYRLVTMWACEQGGGVYIDGREAPVVGLQFFGDKSNFGLHLNTYGHLVFSDWLVYKMRNIGYWN